MEGLAKSTLIQREEFYKEEFSPYKLKKFFRVYPDFFALDEGSETRIIKNREKLNKMINFSCPLSKLKEKLVSHLPEDVYYDRNIYKDKNRAYHYKNFTKDAIADKNYFGQELCFDVDPENSKCPKCKNKKRTLFNFCENCFFISKQNIISLYERLSSRFSLMQAVFSGRGFHLHIFDRHAYKMSFKQRKSLSASLKKKYGIDPWVSNIEIRLIRLPYSLNGLVSRVCLPLKIKEIENFDIKTSKLAIPKFLKSKY